MQCPIAGKFGEMEHGKDFRASVKLYADHYEKDEMIDKPVGVHCSKNK